ncbi:MAG: hypothetical protein HZB26_07570 [Candidatus Hydrogenedentes bacterium]|nr:hypothetical protein [Candidatus Hydrogenedentota bacterium]
MTEPKCVPFDEAQAAEVYELLLNGVTIAQARKVMEKKGVTSEQFDECVQWAHDAMTGATGNRDVEYGKSLARLNRLYRDAIVKSEIKTALSIQKEINRLVGLQGEGIAREKRERMRRQSGLT